MSDRELDFEIESWRVALFEIELDFEIESLTV